ncbi:MAG TPA: ECF RNA polymerase sigma factor SigK [Terrimesophilobacter sp.]|nr:ECF RNA polymerase sigma factor SigK [Terrimesophilobacter sp.]
MLTATRGLDVDAVNQPAPMFEKLVLVPSFPDVDSDSVKDDAPSIDELLSRVATGDQAAFSDLYDETAPRLLGLITRVLIDRAQSEEVAQDVFLEIWQTATRFDRARGSALSWMLTMAHRRAIDRVRSAQAGRDRDVRIGIRDLEPEFDETSELVETRMESERVKVAMASLSELQRQALNLTYFGGYTQTEVAELLSVPLGTVKTRLRDGMIRLRDELGVAS